MKTRKVNKVNKFYLTLLVAVVVVLVEWWLMNDVEARVSGIWEWLIFSFLIYFALPIFIIKSIFKEKISEFHLSLNIKRKDVIVTVLGGTLFIGLLSILVLKLGWYKEFSPSVLFLGNKNVFFLIYFTIFPLTIFFKEFFFSGFLLRSTERVVGVWRAVVVFFIFTIIDFLVISVDFSLIVFSINMMANLFLVWLIFRTRTIVLTFLVSWFISMIIDFTLLYKIGLFS